MCSFLKWLGGQVVLELERRAVLCGVVEQVLQIGGANVQEGGQVAAWRHVEQEVSKVGGHGGTPLQGPSYGVKEPFQGLLAVQVLVELDGPPERRASALLAVGDEGRNADHVFGGQVGKRLGDELVAVGVHGG